MPESAVLSLLLLAVGFSGCRTDGPGRVRSDVDKRTVPLVETAEEQRPMRDEADGDPCAQAAGTGVRGDDLLVVVNRLPERQLAYNWEPVDLAPIPDDLMMPERSGELRYGALLALEALITAADEDGIELGVRSAYRSYDEQCRTFLNKARLRGQEHARRFSALPGRSQHQLGTTVDFTSARLDWAITQNMAEEPEGQWLARHAARFGFVLSYPRDIDTGSGYAFEPWHYRFIGRAAAAEMFAAGLALDDYLAACEEFDGDYSCPRAALPERAPNREWIGGSCRRDLDCALIGEEAVCLTASTGYPSGYCTLPCTATCPDEDGANARTFCVSADDGGLCHSKCDHDLFPETGCRNGYTCRRGRRPSGQLAAKVCLPLAGQTRAAAVTR